MIPARPAAQTPKMTWFVIVLAMVLAIVFYGLIAMLLPRESLPVQPPAVLSMLRPFLFAFGMVCVLGAIGWIYRNAQGSATTTLPSPRDFNTATIIGLALAEVGALAGLVLFVLGGPFSDFVLLALGALAVDLLYILPKGRSYWTAWEEKQKLGR